MSYRVYRYGCRPPTAGADAALEQMRLRVRLWNALVELEQRYRADVEALLAELAPGAEAAARPPAGADAAAYRAARRAAFRRDDVRARLADLEAGRRAAVKAAQAEAASAGLWWGNYDDVIASYNVARRRPGGELRFHSWYRTRGKVSVRYQTGLPLSAAYAETDTRFQLRALPADTWDTRRGQRHARTVARVRIGSDGRAPRWLELPVLQHRPIPAGSVVRQVAVTRELLGGNVRWHLLVVVDEPERIALAPSGPTVAINLGWRVRPDGLRIAFWRDAAGASGEVVLPTRWREQYDKCAAIRGHRDLAFNAARDRLVAFLAGAPDVPAWLAVGAANLPLWRSSERLARLVRQWGDARFAGDEAVYAELAAWRRRERHLQEYEVNTRDQLLAQRLNAYRTFAAQVARRAGQVRLHELDLQEVAARGASGRADELVPAARHNRVQAAVSTLRLSVEQACAREGVAVVVVPAGEPITQTCAWCRTVQHFDAAAHLEHTCAVCGRRWDQDENACRNMLAWTPPQPDMPSESVGGLRAETTVSEASA